MPVTCPHCSTRYVLPEALLGPGGARVRCPRCREPFAVGPDGGEVVALPENGADRPATNGAAKIAAPEIPAAEATHATTAASPATATHAGPPVLPAAASLGSPQRIEGEVHASAEDSASPDDTSFHSVRESIAARAAAAARDEAATSEPAAARNAAASAAPEANTPQAIARAVLDDLDSHSGEAISASRAQGKLFREFGPVIAEAFEFYRRRVGSNADPAPFRAALRERWGVDLEPGHPTKRLI